MSNPSISSSGNPPTNSRLLWQGDRRSTSLIGGFRRRLTQLLWGGLLLTALLLFAWLVWLLLLSPKRTPLVVLSAAPYAWPLPPNDWVTEDLEHLAVLDGETVSLRAIDAPIYKAADFLERLDEEIKLTATLDQRVPLIVWVSMHGVAEQSSDTIRLIPPHASPTDSDSWIDFDDLMDRLDTVHEDRNTLLILDCNRMLVNWNVGLVANRFAEQVQRAYRDRQEGNTGHGNLSILMSADSEQASIASADLSGSVFGNYVRLGLAGDADRQSNGGDGDGWVKVLELHRYVRSRVSWWTKQSRGRQQTPVLMSPTDETDFRLARCLTTGELDKLISDQATGIRPAPTVSGTQLDLLWKSIDQFRQQQLYRQEPIAFRNLEHDVLWLEQLSGAGKGYQTTARRTLERVGGALKVIENRISKLPSEGTISSASSLISGIQPALPRVLKVHSLSLAEFFGTQPKAATDRLRSKLATWIDQPDPVGLSATIDEFENDSNTHYASAHFMVMLQRYQTSDFWDDESTVSDLLKLQSDLNDFAVPRDQNGIPTDLRAHRWNRFLLARVDASRRALEDQAFLNQQSGLTDKIRQTRTHLQESARSASLADQAMQVCDRAMAVTPYFAQWITHPGRRLDLDQTKDLVDKTVLPLIDNSFELASQLDVPIDTSDEAFDVTGRVLGINQFATKNVTPLLGSLESQWSQRQQQLVYESESDQVETIGEIEAVLSIPLVDWKTRRALRGALDRMTARVEQALENPVGETDSSNPNQAGIFAAVESWDRHPLDAILGEQPSSGEATQSDAAANRIASFLNRSASRLADRTGEASISGQRGICSDVASRIRAAAPIWFAVPKRNAIAELRQLDLQSLLMWHAQRALADFWGPAGGDRSFFDVAVNDYCTSVLEMNRAVADGESQDGGPVEVLDALAQVNASREFLPQWITTSAGPTIQLDPEDPFQSQFTITTKADTSFNPPDGTASIVVRSESERIPVPRIEPSDAVVLPGVGQTYVVTLPAGLAKYGDTLKAQTIFRGHEFGGTLDVDQLDGVKVDVRPPTYRHSDVTLSGPWDKLSVVFVLDCSASMNEPLVGDEQAAETSRMEVAKSALQELLFSLGLRRNVRVGVRAFGHRLGWSVDEPVQPLTRPDITGMLDPDLTPSQDVESILMLNDFQLADAQTVVPKIGEVKPWGQSPLYLSVLQSLEEFSTADARADRHVIVITDGANYQFIPPTIAGIQKTTDNDVRQAWGSRQTPVHILGLGMDRSQQPEAVGEFTRLCADTGGRFQALTGSTDLARALRELLAPGGYRLLPLQDDQRPEQQSTLGTPIRVTPVPQSSESFGIQYQGRQFVDASAGVQAATAFEPVVLAGGESIQLYVNEAGSDIFAYPFQDNVVAVSDLVNGDAVAMEHVVRLHRPSRQPGGRVSFPLSWQRRDPRPGSDAPRWRVTDRPSDVWIEIQPMEPGGKVSDVKYLFCDTAYVAEQPVPMMNLVADQWPEPATNARIRVWSKPPLPSSDIELLAPGNVVGEVASSSHLNKIIAVNEALEKSSVIAPGIAIRIDPLGTSTQGDVGRRRFVVEFSDSSPDVTSIKIDVDRSIATPPIRIVRQFDPQHRVSVHTFYYDASRAEFPSEVRVTNRGHETDGAWSLGSDFLEVAIPDSGGLLPVGYRGGN